MGKGEKVMKKRSVLAGIIGLMVCFTFLFVMGCAKKTVIKEEAATTKEKAATEQTATDKGILKDKAVKTGETATGASEEKPLTDMASKEQAASGAALEAAEKEKTLADINFDFDNYSLKPGAREILKGHAAWLAKNKDSKLVIEGHCDERGTTEYNLALGERRAAEAKKYLTELGVDAKIMKTISYGKEMPLDPGHTEEAWAKNRRDHFVVTP
jgi:peptidoglycan-associated lipoprotein